MTRVTFKVAVLGAGLLSILSLLACGSGEEHQSSQAKLASHAGRSPGGSEHGERPGRPGGGPGGGSAEAVAAVPVEIARVKRRTVSSYLETHGTLEAENEVDLVARVSAPVVEIATEEGRSIEKGALLARLDDVELKARSEGSRVALEEARQAWKRASSLQESELISPEAFDAAVARFETARAQHETDRIQLGYTEIRAPFSGLVVARYIHLAEQVASGSPLFRLSDFDPLLCPIQVPEREIPRLRVGQLAYVEVEAWPGERFSASVLRIRPVIDSATGTVKVTLEVEAEGRLRPGMFARVFVEVEKREAALVIPKAALSLESLGDTVFVVEEGMARRREVELGFREGDSVEVRSGLAEGEEIVSVGQDGLSDGTPVRTLAGEAAAGKPPAAESASGPDGSGPGKGGPGMRDGGMQGRGKGFDPSTMSPEELEKVKERMRSRGLSDEEIEGIIAKRREQASQ